MERFSKRHGHSLKEKEISIREDAPQELRGFVMMAVYDLDYYPSYLRGIVCRVLRIAPDDNNWSEYPNIAGEVQRLISTCEWFYVYDIIEVLAQKITGDKQTKFQEEINDYFKTNGIGWKLQNGIIEYRGDETFETALAKVESVLDTAKLQTAKSEIKEAMLDLSRRPKPDITGAIQHSLASLECVCREVSGEKNSTLGEIMKKAGSLVPTPLDQAISKIWGYTSEQGRHLREGEEPSYHEAELLVELSAAISSYLGNKLVDLKKQESDDLPF
jgi:hypothetical protein